jgi:hypothetical protein
MSYKLFNKNFIPGICFSLLCLLSCKKDRDNTPAPEPPVSQAPCRLEKAYFFGDSPTPTDSVSIVYEGSNLTKLQSPRKGYWRFDYNGTKVIKKSLVDFNGDYYVYDYTDITYDTDSLVTKMKYYRISGTGGYEQLNEFDFAYTNGKLTKCTAYAVEGGVLNPNAQIHDYTYTGDNITQMVFTDYFFGQPTTTYTLSYDTKKNYYQKQSPQPWLTDLLMTSFFPDALPYYLSANNVVQISYGGTTIPITYTEDDRQNLTEVRRGGAPQIRYGYSCP